MRKWFLPAIIFLSANATYAQLSPLTVDKIMRDPKWMGTSPDRIFWGADNQTVYFNWNPEKAIADSMYFIHTKDIHPNKTAAADRALLNARKNGTYNADHSLLAYSFYGDVYLMDTKTGKVIRITNTTAQEYGAVFTNNEQAIAFQQGRDLFTWNRADGAISQLTNFKSGTPPPPEKSDLDKGNAQEKWLKAQQLQLLDIIRDKKAKADAATAYNKQNAPKPLRSLYTEDKDVQNVQISPDGRYITYRLFAAPKDAKSTIVPDYVTSTGFTTDIPSREKVGAPEGSFTSFVYDRVADTVLAISIKELPGIKDQPDYVKDYTKKDSAVVREVIINGPYWTDNGKHAIMDIRSQDNKDRWIALLDPATGKLKSVNRQRDEAWIAGPGIGWSFGGANLGWIDDNTCWYQSEASGYSHLYTTNVLTGEQKQLTSGNYEVQEAELSRDKKTFYISTNEVHPGEKQFYKLSLVSGKTERITTMQGANEVTVSPDEKWIAFRYSSSNQPWELYIQPNTPGAKAQQVTNLAQSAEFKSYNWRVPQLITYTSGDNQQVYARLYTPDPARKNGAGVIFVHGAGYLQNAHRWWSQYFREYMFHNLLTDLGYTVMDVDYRGSSGYGRNWRTGIYRFMGGKDLDDEVDAAKYMAEKAGVDAKRIGIYGGSYGGFMTLMAMFTKPGTFAAGAALRSVTDWAHYNHGYTSNILNEPFKDSIAYLRSSPIYHAEGLKGKLLMCHGMVDTNVHFEDIVRLSQRLIELGKDNWELAVFPVEDHGFTTPSSWTDEYKRILKLFNETLLK
ncbi:dipeptidyl aminopeptidase/acylaminoacyl peptidase [Chitinophaga dinghuensis]|uniref:Dipeptidyl aminopeptidase/acylaminoacyl peptidase n=1 Tax=Chitinophaga dinghuensis TaxID=1539050 RepID=A0A327WBB0_9BACT|nr:prolyl oligopeptidase family serine peptidase [Chitinophaga dinghuensis]RAJ83388.1 dipeptidyl aminopeptidase/acylaminoacyl peptidase [Chitinophaga dinghuensis]